MSFCFYAVCIAFCAQSATVVPFSEADVQIWYRPTGLFARPCVGGFVRDDEVRVDCGSRGMRNVCDVLEEQILAGYVPHSKLESRYLCPELLHTNAWRYVCQGQSFHSQAIRDCLECIGSQRSHVEKLLGVLDLTLTLDVVHKRFYPEGKTRLWNVLQKDALNGPWRDDTIYMGFLQSPYVIRGILCDAVDHEDEIPSGSFLALKRRFEQSAPPIEEPILKPFKQPGQQGVGLVYFSKDGVRSALFDVCGAMVTANVPGAADFFRRRVPLFSFMQEQVLFGYQTKCANLEVNCDALVSQKMREAVCYKNCFVSKGLNDVLMGVLKSFVQKKESLLKTSEWGGALLPEDFDQWCRYGQTLQWHVTDYGSFLCQLHDADPKSKDDTVFVIFLGEPVALQGVPMPYFGQISDVPPQGSLAFYKNKQILKEATAARTVKSWWP